MGLGECVCVGIHKVFPCDPTLFASHPLCKLLKKCSEIKQSRQLFTGIICNDCVAKENSFILRQIFRQFNVLNR